MAIRVNKTTAAVAVIVLIGIAALVIYMQSSSNDDTKTSTTKSSSQSSSSFDTLTPSELSADHTIYAGKEVRVKGKLAKYNGGYTIFDSSGAKRLSFLIDTSKIGGDKLSAYFSGGKMETDKTYIITGTYKEDINPADGSGSSVALVAKSVSEQ